MVEIARDASPVLVTVTVWTAELCSQTTGPKSSEVVLRPTTGPEARTLIAGIAGTSASITAAASRAAIRLDIHPSSSPTRLGPTADPAALSLALTVTGKQLNCG